MFANWSIDFIKIVENINFLTIFLILLTYLLLFWLSIVVWVFFDAKRRHDEPWIPFIVSIMVFALFIPGLVFYLIIREPLIDDYEDDLLHGGINVPLVNFLGDEGFNITLDLNIHKLSEQAKSDMKVKVDWESNNKDMELIHKDEEVLSGNNEKVKEKEINKIVDKVKKIKFKINKEEKVENFKNDDKEEGFIDNKGKQKKNKNWKKKFHKKKNKDNNNNYKSNHEHDMRDKKNDWGGDKDTEKSKE